MNIKSFFIFFATFFRNIFHSKRSLGRCHKYTQVPPVKYPLFLSNLNKTWNFLSDFLKIQNLTKILPFGAEFFHDDIQTEGRTDRRIERYAGMTKLIFSCPNFANAPTHGNVIHFYKSKFSWQQARLKKIYITAF